MEWLDKLTQQKLFPGQYIYKVEPIFEEYDIHKVRVMDVTFNLIGLEEFTYETLNRTECGIWQRSRMNYINEQAFFHSVQDAIDWCKVNNKKFTIYD